MNILIVKHGALGDVVRTSYYARSLKEKYLNNVNIWWLTVLSSTPLLRFNPYIDHIITEAQVLQNIEFDIIYSLDDEIEILQAVSKLAYKKLVGAYLKDGNPQYTDDSNLWFDMGLISKFGKAKADKLKKSNSQSHTEIFKQIFGVQTVIPEFFNSNIIEQSESYNISNTLQNAKFIGINAFSGDRWKSKAINNTALMETIDYLLNKNNNQITYIYLFGGKQELVKNNEIKQKFNNDYRVLVPDTGSNILKFAAIIKKMNLLISTDSLALHLAIAQSVPSISVFTATSAIEIDNFGNGAKVISQSADYCSYRPDADNSTIKAQDILSAFNQFSIYGKSYGN